MDGGLTAHELSLSLSLYFFFFYSWLSPSVFSSIFFVSFFLPQNSKSDIGTIEKTTSEKIFERSGIHRELKKNKKLIFVAKKRLNEISGQHERAEKQRLHLVKEVQTTLATKEMTKKLVETERKAADALEREKIVLTSDARTVSESKKS